MKFAVVYIAFFIGLFFTNQATAQSRNSLLEQLTNTDWEAPFFDQHIDFDTLTLHKINRRTSYAHTRELQFLPEGEITTDWYYYKNMDRGCTIGQLWVNKNLSRYTLRGDTLQMTIVGEYNGVEEFNFKRDYLVKRINKKKIQLSLVKSYFGEPCATLIRYRNELTEPTIAPPHPNLRKKQ